MIYLYQNQETLEIIEKYFSIKDKKPTFIRKNGQKYIRIYTVPNIVIDLDKPKTVGSLAEKNTSKMAKEGKLDPPKETPWWRKGKKIDKSLSNLKGKALKRYIKDGVK
jgi:hypothetical protein